ncbi:MAG: DUF2807 domain-containing protein, partial [Bacteroidales bacterium]
MKIKTLLTIAVLTALTINATTAQNTISKKYTYRDTTVAEFYKVTVSSAINVIYRQNSDSSQIARIYASNNTAGIVKLKVQDGNLNIKYGKEYTKDFGIIVVYIYSKSLISVDCSGGGVFSTDGTVSGSFVSLKVTGDSQIRCTQLKYNNIKGRRGIGRGDLIIGGTADMAELSILGRGEINAENLITDDIKGRI